MDHILELVPGLEEIVHTISLVLPGFAGGRSDDEGKAQSAFSNSFDDCIFSNS